MKRNKWVYLSGLLLSLIMVMGFATFCMASGAGNAPVAAPEGKPPVFGNLYVIGWTAVNFFVLLALLYKFAFNPINQMLEERANTIESSIKHAEEVKVEVDQLKIEAQANLAESRKEAQEIIARATKAAEDAKNEIAAKAKEEADNMKAKAHAEIEAATEAAKLELKDTAATLAMMAAEKVLGRAITDEDHTKMVKEFVNEAGDFLC
ncbi:ATPase, F0 complex, subunit B/B', bacterial/chloroplast [Syntrophomonas zehnderi OL-4]|uniref:ATP synthase subunit b n=1 Tax=Syntrophomonas zehnderi OL-4 TaxID=690567 RepID=A0A0E4G920_9FIRM|nr:F0F1 ATP synthase subunit B [Syntrophomonas zehnderi]CFX02976.1 ATPase, F0 complex, subunit B/B', bacterial/chloroplast [Syntrophomonas zehnderi OL-4]